jgi:hypothetical protein
MTVDRTLQGLHALGLLQCREVEEVRASRTVQTRFYSLADDINPEVLGVDCSQGGPADFSDPQEADLIDQPKADFRDRSEGEDGRIIW